MIEETDTTIAALEAEVVRLSKVKRVTELEAEVARLRAEVEE